MSSTESELDLERIAAFIDGRLSGDERARVVKMLAESDEALEVFADAVRLQRDVAPAAPRVLPLPAPRWWRRGTIVVPLAAAAALAIIAVPTMTARREHPDLGARPLAALLALDSGYATRLDAGWEQRGWSVTRGGAPARDPRNPARDAGLTEPALAFRLGVRAVDLQVALARGERTVAGSITNDILDALAAVNFSEIVAASYRDLGSRLAADPLPQLSERASGAEHELDGILASPRFTFGKWVGAAELAARTGNRSFFESKTTARFIRESIEPGELAAEDAEALRLIQARVGRGLDDRALEEIGENLRAIIRRRGS